MSWNLKSGITEIWKFDKWPKNNEAIVMMIFSYVHHFVTLNFLVVLNPSFALLQMTTLVFISAYILLRMFFLIRVRMTSLSTWFLTSKTSFVRLPVFFKSYFLLCMSRRSCLWLDDFSEYRSQTIRSLPYLRSSYC